MKKHLEKYVKNGNSILDVGSLNVKNKGCYKQILPEGCSYIGIDLTSGENVDLVLKDPYSFPFTSNTFDFVISGQCFEHTENPFKLILECSRVLKHEGYFLGVAPSRWPLHRHPIDCWRILPDGWRSLFKEAGLNLINSYLIPIEDAFEDCWGIAWKP